MKKILFICLSLCLFSCSSDEENYEATSASKIENVLKIKNEDDQRLAYGLLSAKEKLNLWSTKMKTLSKDASLNTKQIELINDLQEKLTVSLFSDIKNDEQEYFKTIYVNNFLKKAKEEFSYDQITSFFYTINLKSADTAMYQDDGPRIGSSKKCNCNKGSLFGCSAGGTDECKNITCKESTSGCGFIWKHPCNGGCSYL